MLENEQIEVVPLTGTHLKDNYQELLEYFRQKIMDASYIQKRNKQNIKPSLKTIYLGDI